MNKFYQMESNQVNCKHEFSFTKDEETGEIYTRSDAVCPKCGLKKTQQSIDYEPHVEAWEPDKWQKR